MSKLQVKQNATVAENKDLTGRIKQPTTELSNSQSELAAATKAKCEELKGTPGFLQAARAVAEQERDAAW